MRSYGVATPGSRADSRASRATLPSASMWYEESTRDGSALAIHHFSVGPGDLEARKQRKTTHNRVWRGAQLCLQYLERAQELLGLQTPGLRVFERSGTGWLGLAWQCTCRSAI